MGFFNDLTVKPWLQSEKIDQATADKAPLASPGKTALKFFLAVVSVLFLLFTITFLSRSQFGDFQALAGEPWLPLENKSQLWLNTFYIFLASVVLHGASKYAGKISARRHTLLVAIAIMLSFVFIQGQYQVWQMMITNGYFVYSNPANSFFYLFTGLHALHLLGGVFVLLRLLVIYQQKPNKQSFSSALALTSTYWHYLFLVWLCLFALLTSSTETFKVIAELCGF
ncbi:cytochrome c oxidase subunit 3 [Thalassotalea sp. ND16A]|uniref:cytochrome c oxidase subunit 3 n=1 Tax=Thalassotalea sp. ND16A TaxID=1535422 RepID=UPI00051A1B65|nr:cytochrome c oxidase subunit 3 [Thalassotalea sp. ND16A]KGJ96500.1 hypothetical protein ND16A_1082 [Thalassotalea sp. ND16A]